MTSRDQPATPATTSLANRYGGQKRALSTSVKRGLLLAALAAGIAFMGWVSTSNATSSVTFKDIGYSTPDGTLAEIDFQVTKDPAAAATCAVKALDSKFAVVGWKVLQIGPTAADAGLDGGRTTSHRVQLRTESAAVSAVVDSCWLTEKAR